MGGAGPSTRFGFAGLARRRRLIGDSQDHGLSGDDPEPSIKLPHPPEEEVDDVLREAPKVASTDAPGAECLVGFSGAPA